VVELRSSHLIPSVLHVDQKAFFALHPLFFLQNVAPRQKASLTLLGLLSANEIGKAMALDAKVRLQRV
jgi:hypothetical protein